MQQNNFNITALEKIQGVRVVNESSTLKTQSLTVCIPIDHIEAIQTFFFTLDDHYVIDANAFS